MDDVRRAFGLDPDNGSEENTVSFELYPPPTTGDPSSSSSSSSSSSGAAARLEAVAAQVMHHLLPCLQGYIWQRDRFNLLPSTAQPPPWRTQRKHRRPSAANGSTSGGVAAPVSQGPEETEPCLWGSLCFGDNIEDEWFVTWLLLEATRALPGLAARAWDNDGEFLLIEAAYALPRWLKPETARNRVWLLGGSLHLLPLPRSVQDPALSATPTLAQALAAIRGQEVNTTAPAKLKAALQARLELYPARARQLMHQAHAVVPAALARLLAAEPQLVAAAAEAFHYRDPDDMKAASRMAVFPPTELVPASVRFSRCLYAQLALQEYAPPRGYPLPLPSDPSFKAAELGMKLASGFEMVHANRARFGQEEAEGACQRAALLVQEPAGVSPATVLQGDPGWQAVQAWLQASGQLPGQPGSQQHSQALQAAAQRYRQSQAYAITTQALAAPALLMDALLQGEASSALPLLPPEALQPADSDAWLQEGSEQLDRELMQRQAELEAYQQRKAQQRQQASGKGSGAARTETSMAAGKVVGEEEFDPGAVSRSLRAFVEAMSGLEGAEVPGEQGDGKEVSLQAGRFAAELENALGLQMGTLQLDGDDVETASESSEEGSSFYSGSSSESDTEGEALPHQQRPSSARAAAAAARVAGGRQQPSPADQERWEAATATDSDDEGAVFMEAYSRALDRQLAATKMAESFELAPGPAAGGQGTEEHQAAAATTAAAATGTGASTSHPSAADAAVDSEEEGGEGEAAMRPVDVDLNLVKSLLASYSSQQGLPGPASNLAGLLGFKLPDAEL